KMILQKQFSIFLFAILISLNINLVLGFILFGVKDRSTSETENWEDVQNQTSGRFYYRNRLTGQIQTKDPRWKFESESSTSNWPTSLSLAGTFKYLALKVNKKESKN